MLSAGFEDEEAAVREEGALPLRLDSSTRLCELELGYDDRWEPEGADEEIDVRGLMLGGGGGGVIL